MKSYPLSHWCDNTKFAVRCRLLLSMQWEENLYAPSNMSEKSILLWIFHYFPQWNENQLFISLSIYTDMSRVFIENGMAGCFFFSISCVRLFKRILISTRRFAAIHIWHCCWFSHFFFGFSSLLSTFHFHLCSHSPFALIFASSNIRNRRVNQINETNEQQQKKQIQWIRVMESNTTAHQTHTDQIETKKRKSKKRNKTAPKKEKKAYTLK